MTYRIPAQAGRGFTLIELLVIVSIIAVLASLLLPALARAKAKGRQTHCLGNLKQIAVGYALYRDDNDGRNVAYRLCPDTPSDPYGSTAGVPSSNAPNDPPATGPNEIWWAPYDPTQVPDGPPGLGFKLGLLYQYMRHTNLFKCSVEPKWQSGYGMNYSEGSPMARPDASVTQPVERLVIWDHRRSPGCADSRMMAPRLPWLPFTAESHYPPRHGGKFNALFYDGHVIAMRQSDLRLRNFREPGSGPSVPSYPGE
jgi:prepilin-type processing-associated H-X9-DG protein/prepilin-type N-terminal cleavage/methylation domain-containing protein